LSAILSTGVCFAEESAVLAEIGDKKITQADYDRIVEFFPEDIQKTLKAKPELRKKFLLGMVQVELFSDIARQKKIDEIPDVKEQIKMLVDDFLSKEALKREVVDKIVVTEEDMKSYYNVNKEAYKIPEMVRARHILVKAPKDATEAEKAESSKKAEEILKRIKAGEDFAELATEFSEDKGSKGKGGNLGFFPRDRMAKPFEDAAFSLKPGEVSDIIETKFGYHIIKLEERKEAKQQSFEDVKKETKNALLKLYKSEKVKAYVDDAMDKAGVKIYYDRIQLK
ncbi:MAG: peptidylprolyl isomerase, partial [Candidatus Mariimomonas ferrooxydans]